MSPPDWISLCRIPCGLIFPFVGIYGRLALLIVAALSDILDGFLARRFYWESPIGKIVDPLSDKLFALMAIGTFWYEGVFPWLYFPFYFARDIALVVFFLFRSLRGEGRSIKLQSIIAGKMFTTAQFMLLFWLAMGFGFPLFFLPLFAFLGIASFCELLGSLRKNRQEDA